MLTKKRRKNGKYSTDFFRKGFYSDLISGAKNALKDDIPRHFLFRDNSLLQEYFRQLGKRKTSKSLSIPKSVAQYFGMLIIMNSEVRDFFNSISYIGPIRDNPKRYYEISGEIPPTVGVKGEYAPEIFFRAKKNSEFVKDVNAWVRNFDFGYRVTQKAKFSNTFALELYKSAKMPDVNFSDIGFGMSQIFPLIVQGFHANKEDIIIFEQPEIHLNPSLQSKLADLFVEFVKRKRNLIIETHSEHLLLRVRSLVAEGKIKADQISLCFVEKEKLETRIRQIPISKNGHIELGDWPKGFFQDSLKQALHLVSRQAQHKK